MTKTLQQLAGAHILSLIGHQGTGKTTLAKLISDQLQAQYIETSEIVVELCGEKARSELPKTADLTKDDPEWLARGIANRVNRKLVSLAGVREEAVHDTLRKYAASLVVIGLWAPQNERFMRVKSQGKVEEYKDFVKQDSAELKMGLHEMCNNRGLPTVITSYVSPEQNAKLIIDKLSKRWNKKP